MSLRETRTDSEGLGGTRLPDKASTSQRGVRCVWPLREHCAVQCMFLRELQACTHVII